MADRTGKRFPMAPRIVGIGNHSRLFLTSLVLVAASSTIAQPLLTPKVPACKAVQIELYDLGGSGATGHEAGEIGIRNISSSDCTLSGVPEFRVISPQHQPVAIAYTRNKGNFMFPAQPQLPVILAPGAFASFLTGDSVCQNDSLCVPFIAREISLPGDNTWLRISSRQVPDYRSYIDISAIRAGIWSGDVVPPWQPPIIPVNSIASSLPGVDLALHIPKDPHDGFPAHFTLRNTTSKPVTVDWEKCVLNEQLTNSAGKTVSDSLPCRTWIGAVGANGTLALGTAASMDITLGQVALQLCRYGAWQMDIELVTGLGTVTFERFPFVIHEITGCSDSAATENSEDLPDKDIRWTLVPRYGVRLGVAVRAPGNTDPELAKFPNGSSQPAFHEGQPIELHLFLDNLSDEPVKALLGPGDFRILVSRETPGVPVVEIAPKSVSTAAVAAQSVTVPPHMRQFVETKLLTSQYELPPGDYSVYIGPRSLQGNAAKANAPEHGWIYTLDAATTDVLINVIE